MGNEQSIVRQATLFITTRQVQHYAALCLAERFYNGRVVYTALMDDFPQASISWHQKTTVEVFTNKDCHLGLKGYHLFHGFEDTVPAVLLIT